MTEKNNNVTCKYTISPNVYSYHVDVGELSSCQISALTTSMISSISTYDISKLNPINSNYSNSYQTNLANCQISNLTTTMVGELSTSNISSLTINQSMYDDLKYFEKKLIQGIVIPSNWVPPELKPIQTIDNMLSINDIKSLSSMTKNVNTSDCQITTVDWSKYNLSPYAVELKTTISPLNSLQNDINKLNIADLSKITADQINKTTPPTKSMPCVQKDSSTLPPHFEFHSSYIEPKTNNEISTYFTYYDDLNRIHLNVDGSVVYFTNKISRNGELSFDEAMTNCANMFWEKQLESKIKYSISNFIIQYLDDSNNSSITLNCDGTVTYKGNLSPNENSEKFWEIMFTTYHEQINKKLQELNN